MWFEGSKLQNCIATRKHDAIKKHPVNLCVISDFVTSFFLLILSIYLRIYTEYLNIQNLLNLYIQELGNDTKYGGRVPYNGVNTPTYRGIT